MQLAKQIHEGSKNPEDFIFKISSENSSDWFTKPNGGFWTSTYNSLYGSEWIRWATSEEFRHPPFKCWLVYPNKDAKILHLKDADDWIRFTETYKVPDQRFPPNHILHTLGQYKIQWEPIAESYDAVHITSECATGGHFLHGLSNNCWDVESTVWFRKAYTATFFGTRNFKVVWQE